MPRARASIGEQAVEEEVDPYAGPGLDPGRGLRKAGWRLYVFYGAFAPVVVLAFVVLAHTLPKHIASFVWAWGATYVVLNFLSGGLPGPNLVRYNKDLEIVAPLACIALGAGWERLWSHGNWRRALAVGAGSAWVLYGALRALQSLAASSVIER